MREDLHNFELKMKVALAIVYLALWMGFTIYFMDSRVKK